MQYDDVMTNQIWRTANNLKMVLSLYLSDRSSDFDEIWCTDANFGSKNGHMTKIKIFLIHNGGWLPF